MRPPKPPAAVSDNDPLLVAAKRRQRAKKETLCLRFAEMGTVTEAARAVGVGVRTIYTWCAQDAKFRQQFEDARELAAGVCEAEVRRRGKDGVQEPAFYKGEVVYYVTKYFDTCLLAIIERLPRPVAGTYPFSTVPPRLFRA